MTRGRPIHLECVCVFRWGGGALHVCAWGLVSEREPVFTCCPPFTNRGRGSPGPHRKLGSRTTRQGGPPLPPPPSRGRYTKWKSRLGSLRSR